MFYFLTTDLSRALYLTGTNYLRNFFEEPLFADFAQNSQK